MVVVLTGAGALALVAGSVAILFSISIRDFSFGSTLMIVGSIGAAAGLVVLALAQVIREIRQLNLQPAMPMTRPEFPARPIPPTATIPPVEPPPFAAPPRSLTERSAPQARPEEKPDAMPAAAPGDAPAPPAPTKRNLLFRRPPSAGPVAPDAGAEFAAAAAAERAPRAESTPPPAVEGLWKRRRGAAAETPAPPASPLFDLPGDGAAETPRVTVLKSGVVDGMAYTLYSDGSIEAQLAEGMVRFDSIEALRAHLNRPG